MKRGKKVRQKSVVAVLVAVAAMLVLLLGVLVYFQLPKSIQALDSGYDLSRIADGVYIGKCENGIIRVQVEVMVQNHGIADIQITQHRNGLGGAAEGIVDAVVQRQSVEVDVVTGATMSSQAILKAVENALSEGTEEKE